VIDVVDHHLDCTVQDGARGPSFDANTFRVHFEPDLSILEPVDPVDVLASPVSAPIVMLMPAIIGDELSGIVSRECTFLLVHPALESLHLRGRKTAVRPASEVCIELLHFAVLGRHANVMQVGREQQERQLKRRQLV